MNRPSCGSRKSKFLGRLDKLERTTNAAGTKLKNSIKAVARCVGIFPPMKSALDDMAELVGILEGIVEGDEDLYELFTDLQARTDALQTYITKLDLEADNGCVSLVIKSICEHLRYIKQSQEEGGLRGSSAMKRARQVEGLLKQLHDNIELRIWEKVTKTSEEDLLAHLSPTYDARYDSSYATTVQRGSCTSGTRQELQKLLQDWALPETTRPEETHTQLHTIARVFWLNGMAGTGKTTIAYSLCEWLESNTQLGASFFCSRTSKLCRDINRIIPTIAYQLARFSSAYRSALCRVLHDDPDAATRRLQVQFAKLIAQPIESIKETIPDGIVVVIDALDEVEDSYGVATLLELLLQHVADLRIKFFIASRPEPPIRDNIALSNKSLSSVFYLHDIEASIVGEDIRRYLTDALKNIIPLPTQTQILQLTRQSGKLFIYASTLVREYWK
ncbi:unnamed protein product [Rhizoctonia solani]|uniref:Nephrocystin 3-like N-terminal domain-containing protein n=1 Tax=Rhizoctonia solani TaxID=456999 RepID=A0A8H3B8C3_9AGAM|nr:unnamed protein product [Rhizoctonia solani]